MRQRRLLLPSMDDQVIEKMIEHIKNHPLTGLAPRAVLESVVTAFPGVLNDPYFEKLYPNLYAVVLADMQNRNALNKVLPTGCHSNTFTASRFV